MKSRKPIGRTLSHRRLPPLHSRARAAGLAMAGVMAALPAWSQTAAPAPAAAASAADSDGVTTVVVTARKKLERLQDVPLSITSLSSQTLEDAGIKNLQDATHLASGLTINTGGAESYVTPTIRGLTNLNGGAGDPNVAVFLDGVYLANPSAVSLGLLDVDRIELIKGPVSALYGRNAYSGVINYISKKPGDTLEPTALVGFGDHGARTAQASLRGAVVPGLLRAGVSLGYDELDHTHQDAVNGLTVGGWKKQDGQLVVDMVPQKGLSLGASVYLGNDKFENSPISYMTSNCGPTIAGNGPTAGQYRNFCGLITGTQQPIEVANLSGSGATGNSRQVSFSSLRAGYDFGWSDLTTIFGYNDVKEFRFNDFTGYRNGIPFATTAGGTVNLPELFGSEYNNHDSSLEIRLASKPTPGLRWAGGLYGFKGGRQTGTLVSIDGSSLPAGVTLVGATQNFYLRPDGTWNDSTVSRTYSTDKIRSVFGSLDYDILSNLTASAELRHTAMDKSQQSQARAGVAAGQLFTSSIGFNNYRATLQFKPSTSTMFYGSVANGTKGGGFNTNASQSGQYAYELTFKPETNTTYEIGAKQSFLNNKVQASVALFKVNSKDLQINGPSDNPAIVGLLVKNFGGLNSQGLEFDLAAKPLPGLTLNAGLGYADSKFASGTVDYTAADAQSCQVIPSCASRVFSYTTPAGANSVAMNISGMAPPQSSEVTVNLGGQYTGQINEKMSWFGRADYRYESKQYTKFGNANPLGINYIGARNLVNLRAGLESGAWKWTVYINNATNNQTPDIGSNNVRLNDFYGQMFAYLTAPRMIGTTLSVKY